MAPRLTTVPSVAVEILRFFIICLGAGLGYLIGDALAEDSDPVLGPFSAQWVGAIAGSGLGYSLGGVLSRRTITAIERADSALDRMPAEEALAGLLGATAGGLLAAAISWPALLIPMLFGIPIFAFVVTTGILLGFRVGHRRRSAMLSLAGQRAGISPPPTTGATDVRLLDTSVAIDGRIIEIVRAGFLQGRYLLPQPVIDELHGLADSGRNTTRERGRRGLAVLDELRRLPGVDLDVIEDEAPGIPDVDAKLVRTAVARKCALLTFDNGLAKAAGLAGVEVANMQQLALALRPRLAVGDTFSVEVTRRGTERRQAVGYLDDGSMVVVEDAADRIGAEITVVATSVLVTNNGRMIFARDEADPEEDH